jgi:hypothetical protein
MDNQPVRRHQEWKHARTGNRILIRRIADTEADRPMYREGKPWNGPEAFVLSFDTEREWWTTFAAIRRNYELVRDSSFTAD